MPTSSIARIRARWDSHRCEPCRARTCPGHRVGPARQSTGINPPGDFSMFKRTLIALAAVALVSGGAVAVAHAATSQGTTQATCTASPDVVDQGTAQQITVVCTVPKPPEMTLTSTVTATESDGAT